MNTFAKTPNCNRLKEIAINLSTLEIRLVNSIYFFPFTLRTTNHEQNKSQVFSPPFYTDLNFNALIHIFYTSVEVSLRS